MKIDSLPHKPLADAVHAIVVHARPFGDFPAGQTPSFPIAIAPQ
jgi:hypothetical protein